MDAPPPTLLSHGTDLQRLRDRLDDPQTAPAVAHLRRATAAWRAKEPWSVMDKEPVPPSGDKHDYTSLTPYWWPDPEKPDGLPYVYRDGQVNPDIGMYDRHRLGDVALATQALALSAYLEDDADAARHAAKLLRVFFLDDATLMNPHMRFGQFIPGRSDGTPAAIVDSRVVVPLVEAVIVLRASAAPAPVDESRRLDAWFGDFLDWLLTSDQGKRAGQTQNNHANMYDMAVAALALHLGRRDEAKATLAAVAERRIATQVEPDGRQPHELKRTRSWTYSTLNLSLLCRLARLGEHVGVDLWNYTSPDGRSIRAALDFIVDHADKLPESWPHPQLTRFEPDPMALALRLAVRVWPEARYLEVMHRLEATPVAEPETQVVPGVDGLLARLPLLYPIEKN